MLKFCANLSMLFNEVDFIERFGKASRAGFKGVEYLFRSIENAGDDHWIGCEYQPLSTTEDGLEWFNLYR